MSKTFKQFLQETTVPPEYQHVADQWEHHANVDDETQEKIQRAMTKGSFTHFPLDGGMADADPDVVEHLNNHGWDVKDYQKGIAHKTIQVGNPERGIPMREKVVEKKIGSILDETGATPEVKKSFVNDRGQVTAAKHHVVISTSPLAILGMSTGTNWDQQSCMRYPDGFNNHYMQYDSENGTHIAYLVNSDDKTAFQHGEPEAPLARIALKAHHNFDSEGNRDTIFRPENRTYGPSSTSFTKAVSNWAIKNYPAIKNAEYRKNSAVYNDTGDNVYKSLDEDDVKKKIDSAQPIVKAGDTLDHNVIEAAMQHGTKTLFPVKDNNENSASQFIINMSQIGNLTTQHVAKLNKLVNTEFGHNQDLKKALTHIMAFNHGDKFSTSGIRDFISDHGINILPHKMMANTKLPDDVVDQLHPVSYKYVRNAKIKPHHVDKMIDSYMNDDLVNSGDLNDMKSHFTADHISRLINDQTGDTKTTSGLLLPKNLSRILPIVIGHDKFNAQHHADAINRLRSIPFEYGEKDASFNSLMRKSKFAKLEDFSDRKNNLVQLMNNKNIPEEEHKKIAKEIINRASTSNQNYMSRIPGMQKLAYDYESRAIPEHISKHFTPEDYDKLASNKMDVDFESPKHSNDYLDAIYKQAKVADDKLTNHIKQKMDENDEYDMDEDDEAKHLKDELHSHLANYSGNIDNHINNHVKENGTVKDYDELLHTHDRITGFGKGTLGYLDNYNTPDNSDRWDDHGHYDSYFSDHDEKLHELKNYAGYDD